MYTPQEHIGSRGLIVLDDMRRSDGGTVSYERGTPVLTMTTVSYERGSPVISMATCRPGPCLLNHAPNVLFERVRAICTRLKSTAFQGDFLDEMDEMSSWTMRYSVQGGLM